MDPDLPRRAIATFEQLTGLVVSCHDHTGRLAGRIGQERGSHRNPWCKAVKAVAQPACTTFCCRLVYDAVGRPEPVCTRCHAGLVQWAVAGVLEGRRTWVLFAGMRRPRPGLRIDLRDPAAPPELPGWLDGPQPPPLADRPEVMAEALAQLNDRLLAWLVTAASEPSGTAPQQRDQAIRSFLRARYADQIGLVDLARHLGLSVDRTRHAVQESCGVGFARLLAEERLRAAAELLRHTDLPVVEVARRSGFGSIAHFHARFRLRWRCTPAVLRARAHA